MKQYSFDVSLTDDCNFACKYCIERGYFKPNYMQPDVADKIIEKITAMEKLYPDLERIGIGFWGGEPTLNMPIIKKFTEAFRDDLKIYFMIFSNSYLFDEEFIQYIESFNTESFKRFRVQISYDGFPIHDICRVSRDNQLTGDVVRNNILKYAKRNIGLHLKSTVTFSVFKFMYAAYTDIVNLNDELGITDDKDLLIYAPTLDYSELSTSAANLDDPNVRSEYKSILEDQLQKIAAYECKRNVNKEFTTSVFSWFDPKESMRKNCGAGFEYQLINYDGNVYVCHGCIYVNSKDDHYVTSIFEDDETFFNRLNDCTQKFKDFMNEPEDCKSCDAIVCLRCNSLKYEQSIKSNYIDKWKDYKSQPFLCELYKSATNIIRAMQMIMVGVHNPKE